MAQLNTDPNLDHVDDFYAQLLDAHSRLDEAQTHAFNARLVLILANHIGDQNVLSEALLVGQQTGTDNKNE